LRHTNLEALEQRVPQALVLRLFADDGGWELQVVARQHRTLCLQNRSPRGNLQSLRCLVDDGEIEPFVPQVPGLDASERAADNLTPHE
jgi:hypothetical protein